MALHLRNVDLGSNIGQYRILKKLGAGGMGTVYLGEHILLRRRAAIKTLLPTLSQHAEIVERFFTEARATSAISDPGVVQIFDFGYHVDGTAYIVMELLEGEALAARIERLGRLRPSDALRIARQVASSLAAAHDCGIVHRDLKPENIFLVHDAESQAGERTKILDFGICKLGGEEAGANDDAMIGTPVYMSPEQCRGIANADARSDIYALGCVLFDMLTGRPPFEGDATAEYIAAHMSEEAPAPSALVPDLPPIIDPLLARLLAKDPEDRFQTMGDLVAAIEHVAARLSAPGVVVGEVRVTPAMPLPSGFSSIYQDNGRDDDEPTIPPRPRRSFARVFFAMVLSGVVVIALLAAYDSILADRAAAHAPPVAAAVPDPAPPPEPQPAPPVAAAAPDPDPVPNIAEIDHEIDKLLESAEQDEKAPSLKLPEDKTVQKPVARARQPVRRAVPAPPPPAPPPASRTPGPIPITPPSTPTPTEDLYDSR